VCSNSTRSRQGSIPRGMTTPASSNPSPTSAPSRCPARKRQLAAGAGARWICSDPPGAQASSLHDLKIAQRITDRVFLIAEMGQEYAFERLIDGAGLGKIVRARRACQGAERI